MAELSLEEIIKEGIEQALKEPVADGKSITEWAVIGMRYCPTCGRKMTLSEEERKREWPD